MNIFYTILYLIVWPVFHLILPTRCVGREKIPAGGVLVCCNHTRLNDPLFVVFSFTLRHKLHIMAKEEIMRYPVVGWLLKKAGIFGVKRGEADVAAIKTAMKYLKDGEKVFLFPEGTRHQDGELGEAKTGAAMLAVRCGVPILPLYLAAEKKKFCRNTVYVGDPFYPTVAGKRGTNEEYEAIGADLMGRIRALKEQAGE